MGEDFTLPEVIDLKGDDVPGCQGVEGVQGDGAVDDQGAGGEGVLHAVREDDVGAVADPGGQAVGDGDGQEGVEGHQEDEDRGDASL